jgi:hypothetical protein
MGYARRKVLEIALTLIAYEAAALVVNGGDSCAAVEHDGSFRRRVPKQFVDAASRKAHIHTGP